MFFSNLFYISYKDIVEMRHGEPIKGYGADVLRLPDGRSEPIFVTYDLYANDFKPFLEVPRDVFGSW